MTASCCSLLAPFLEPTFRAFIDHYRDLVEGDGTWACNPDYYAAGDGCDCACGIPDPDCAHPEQELFGCAEGERCGSDGRCEDPA
jgi:hypothetical protein